MKKCLRCGKEKNLSEFYKRKEMTDGYLNICKECKIAEAVKHYKNNREKKLEYQKEYTEKNVEKVKATKKKYYEQNKEQYAKKTKERRENGEFHIIDANHRHKRRAACKETDITIKWLQELRETSIYCPLCETKMIDINLPFHPQQAQLDHIIPLNTGGLHVMDNVRYVCGKCNNSRPKDGSDILKV